MLTDKLKFVYEDVDARGNVRVYVWRGRGHRKVRIREPFGTPEFRKAYDDALAIDTTKSADKKERVNPGTWRWLCARYIAECADYKRLDPKTRKVRKQILEHTCQEKISPEDQRLFGDAPLAAFKVKAVKVLRDRKAELPNAANERVKAIRQVFVWALDEEIDGVEMNPGRDVDYFSTDTEGFHTWTVEEVRKYQEKHPPGTKARLALTLLLFTGARRSDVVTFGRQKVSADWLTWVEAKGQNRKPKTTTIPILPELQAELDLLPQGQMMFLLTTFGKPFTANGFGNWFKKRCRDAELPHCSAHGLRKAGATIAAENGATEHQLMAIYNWDSPKQAARYTRKANRKKLAGGAMHLIDVSK